MVYFNSFFQGWYPGEIIEMFTAAAESYSVLTSIDKGLEFSKDWNHLERRWKVETWTWHRLFIIDSNIEQKNYDHAIIILSNIIKVRFL